ncbi:peroxiredoxin-like family protein [Flavobacterium sp. 7A]|uniref:peroxiredoxin-like family protein n=1 Tax=Flavobacterium sp. 7A TaxID=2940571 RepID=UPI0029CAC087|nr:peroxiredoxin-like family protein [Flavobacterium sp. 7A]MCW2119390.1 peroxiredoxin [Flavobacterium sp. 7A]
MMNRPTPKHKAPTLKFSLLGGSVWDLHEQKPENFTLIIFYRGLHCPVCKKYLEELANLMPAFNKKGVNVMAVSMDKEERARLSRKDWKLKNLPLGYNLTLEMAVNWGLYISKGIKEGEPDLFSEPGLFLVDNKADIYYSAINSNPWGRPYLPSFVDAVDFILANSYPARGEVV